MTAQLIALAGPLQGQTFPLEEESIAIGRHDSNRLVIRQISVSRRHARLERDQDSYRLLDLDSLHGTFVNDGAIQNRPLTDGDLITLGDSLFLYRQVPLTAPPRGKLPSSVKPPPSIEEASTSHAPAVRNLELLRQVRPSHEGEDLARAMPPISRSSATDALIGESESMSELRSLITRIAQVISTVLIDGESGCGKELVARTIHAAGSRAQQPFIAVNCATLSETLLESELFGHEKGAFTGATQQRLGQFERAQGGTIFLDEVGEIPLPLQAKLLRVLQERELERLGGRHIIKIDVRVLAATNRDLAKEVAERRFRDDLYYRLNVIRLTVPPLRNRREDIPLLASHFLHSHAKTLQRSSMALSREARSALAAYHWPGNVRELSNAIERAAVLAERPVLETEDLPEAVLESRPQSSPIGSYHGAINETKRKTILHALDATGGNVTHAARSLGLSPNYLHRLIDNLDLRGHLDTSRQS